MKTSFATLAALLGCLPLPAQYWTELTDAADSIVDAQRCVGSGPLLGIAGITNGDADTYLIEIVDPELFTAEVTSGTAADLQLFLFDERGYAVVGGDDTSSGLWPRLTGAYVPGPGRYHLAVVGFGREPVSRRGNIWASLLASEEPANGYGRRERLTGWTNFATSIGSYQIDLYGAAHVMEQVVLPSNHHVSSSPQQMLSIGSPDFFRETAARFQVVYPASHFLDAGVTGPITIERLLFRGEDGEPSKTSATWTNAVVRVGATATAPGALSSNFALNVLSTPVLGPLGFGTVHMTPSAGGTPNSYHVTIDLAAMGASMVYDPTGPQPNLFVDVSLPNNAVVPSGNPLLQTQAATGGSGVALFAPSGAVTGALVPPPVMAVAFSGGNGANLTPVPARNETIGAASGGSAVSFYQTFVNGQMFDLTGLSLTRTGMHYSVAPLSTPVDRSKVGAAPQSTGDDAVIVVNLGFLLQHPGGVTSAVRVSTNGFLWLNGQFNESDFSPSVPEFLGVTSAKPARLAPCWYDFHCGRNIATHPNSGLHVVHDFSGGPGNSVVYITWLDVGVYNQASVGGVVAYTVQCVLFEGSSRVEFRYEETPRHCATTSLDGSGVAGLVGYSKGSSTGIAAVDPVTRDLSLESPFLTADEGAAGNLRLRTTCPSGQGVEGARLYAGNEVRWVVDNVPVGTVIGVQLLDFAATQPGIQVPLVIASGTMLSTTGNPVLYEVDLLPSSTNVGDNVLVVPPGLDGSPLVAQYVVLGGLSGAPDLITSASQTIVHTIGRN